MKVFISADIEGITTTHRWEETDPAHASYPLHAKQMTDEVIAVCEGAIAAGATAITIKDAHGGANNIDPTRLPKEVTLIRGWSGSPLLMSDGIDSSFDAAMFVGYHSAATRSGNPMSHTISLSHNGIFINGRFASEFLLYSYAAALYGVPTVFLSGDKMLCEDYADLHPSLISVAVKDGIGKSTSCLSVEKTIPELRVQSEMALRQDLLAARISLPALFESEIHFRDHAKAERASYFPEVKKISDTAVSFTRNHFFEVLRTISWII